MKLNFFSSTTRASPTSAGATDNDRPCVETEWSALTKGLHNLLAMLPRAGKDKDQIRELCDAVLDASAHLRLVWVGFATGDEAMVVPHVAVGEAVPEASNWRLPQVCFANDAPYSQVALESEGAIDDYNSLFAPWQDDLDACSANAALAIPLRSDKTDARGLIVFYADDVSYFAKVGSAPFQAFCHVAEIIWQQVSLLQKLAEKSQYDALTGLMNRRKMTALLQRAIARADADGQTVSVILLRIDGFSKINDQYGWSVADAVLAAFAKTVAMQMRAHDKLGRWTGLEFLVILPRTELQHAEFLAQSLQTYFATHELVAQGVSLRIDLQIGAAAHANRQGGLDDLLRRAHRRLSMAAGEDAAAP